MRGGENLSPGEIEDVLLTHPDVADVAIVGVPDEQWGEAVAAAVVAKAGASIDVQVLKDLVKQELRSSRVPAYMDVWSELSQTKPVNCCGGSLRHPSKKRSPELTRVRQLINQSPLEGQCSINALAAQSQQRCSMTTDAARNTDGSAGTGY